VVLAHSGGGLLLAVDGGGFEKDSGRFDLVFPVLHGPGGEDGSVQGMLESLGLPFVGAGSRASAIAMDKLTMKTLAAGAGLPQTDFFEASGLDSEETSACVEKSFGFPCFLKPSGLGSSVGITKVETASGIEAALAEARRYDRRVIVERAVAGRELEMALLGGASPETSPLGEIATATGFYDFKSKYVDTGAALIVPAEVGDNVRSEADALAARVWQLIGCHGMARVDFFLQNDGRLLFNEVNTIPGFTAISMFPRCWQAAGLSMAALVGRLLAGAAERPD
jgi:D-alanine-D-alanine ligase